MSRTLCIPDPPYTQLCTLAEQRGISVNAVILGVLAEACAGRWAGHGPDLLRFERAARVQRTVRIPSQDYIQFLALANAREVGLNAVILGVLAEACLHSADR